MQLINAANTLKELGHPIRLSIYKEVVKYGEKGVPVGTIQGLLGIPSSTLSHHITGLASAKLITQRREGTTLYCVAAYGVLDELIAFLNDECCIEAEE